MFVAVVVNFCELIRRIEDTPSSKLVKTNTLARRSLYILVISIINADITYPYGYREMCNQVQEVCYPFHYLTLPNESRSNIPKGFQVQEFESRALPESLC